MTVEFDGGTCFNPRRRWLLHRWQIVLCTLVWLVLSAAYFVYGSMVGGDRETATLLMMVSFLLQTGGVIVALADWLLAQRANWWVRYLPGVAIMLLFVTVKWLLVGLVCGSMPNGMTDASAYVHDLAELVLGIGFGGLLLEAVVMDARHGVERTHI